MPGPRFDYTGKLFVSVSRPEESAGNEGACALLQDVYEEYDRLRRGAAGGTFHVALGAANEARNRYSNVLPFDANRVRLQARARLHAVCRPLRRSSLLTDCMPMSVCLVCGKALMHDSCMRAATAAAQRLHQCKPAGEPAGCHACVAVHCGPGAFVGADILTAHAARGARCGMRS